MRKVLSLLCAAVLTLGIGVPAYASGAEGGQAPLPEGMMGTIFEETDSQIKVRNINDESDVYVFNVSSDTVIVDSATGMSAGLESRENDLVQVYYGPVMTMSMPPISNAAAIAINVEDVGFSPLFAIAEAVEASENGVKVTAFNGSVIVTIGRDTQIMPYLTRNIATVDDIKIGSELLLWYGNDVVMESFPAQANAERTVIISSPAAAPAATLPAPIVSVDVSETLGRAVVDNCYFVNVRREPNLDKAPFAFIAKGEIVTVLEQRSNWLKASTAKGEGWIDSRYLTMQ